MRWEEKYSQRLIWRLEERNWRPLPFQNSSNGNCAGIWIYFCHSLTSDRHLAISFFLDANEIGRDFGFSLITIKIFGLLGDFLRLLLGIFLQDLFLNMGGRESGIPILPKMWKDTRYCENTSIICLRYSRRSIFSAQSLTTISPRCKNGGEITKS